MGNRIATRPAAIPHLAAARMAAARAAKAAALRRVAAAHAAAARGHRGHAAWVGPSSLTARESHPPRPGEDPPAAPVPAATAAIQRGWAAHRGRRRGAAVRAARHAQPPLRVGAGLACFDLFLTRSAGHVINTCGACRARSASVGPRCKLVESPHRIRVAALSQSPFAWAAWLRRIFSPVCESRVHGSSTPAPPVCRVALI